MRSPWLSSSSSQFLYYSPPSFMLLLLLHLLLLSLFSNGDPCSPTARPCPPFNTTPPFPFSTSPGCGHPSFHLHCSSSSSSLLTINNLSFSLLRYDHPSSSITLSPHPHPNSMSICSHFPTIPPNSINLSGTPFRISDSSCSRLSLLKPCPPPNLSLPNCSLCPWHCSLIKNPTRLLAGCGSDAQPISEQGCQSDILGFLDKFLKFGIQIQWDESSDLYFNRCKDCRIRQNGVCGFKSSDPGKPFLCLVDDKGSILHRRRNTFLAAIFVLLCLAFFLGVGFLAFRNQKLGEYHYRNSLEDPTTLFLQQNRSASLLPPVFTYEELEASTNRFDPKRKIGDGGFGSVFLGQLVDERVVAVKYLHGHHNHQAAAGGRSTVSSKSFCNEILILSSISHPNLVKLHGYCSDPRGLLLVYDYIPNGTLADHLHGPTRRKGLLNWPTRVDIALQVAIAMEYLHFMVQPPVVHRDITSSNIFVDQNMRVRVGDFGLSRLLIYPDPKLSGELGTASSGCVWTGPQGTPGYLDPDYYKCFRLTEKSDVYSFGVVLMEMISGLKAVDHKREKREMTLVDMMVAKIQIGLLEKVVDPVVAAEGGAGVAAVAELAFRCVAEDKDDRPDAREVVAELRRIWSRTRGVRGSNSNVVVVPGAGES